MRPFTSSLSFLFASSVASLLTSFVWAEDEVRLLEKFPANYQFHVSTRVELTGKVTVPPDAKSAGGKEKAAPQSLTVSGTSAIEYDERILAVAADGKVEKSARIYRRVDLHRKMGEQTQEAGIRPAVRRLVLVRLKSSEVPFSPDGPLTWAEIDFVRTDVFTPALIGLLPEKAVKKGDRWTADNAAIEELTDMEKIEEGKVECRMDDVYTLSGRKQALVSFVGKVKGVNEDGPTGQELEGSLYFDLESNHLSYLTLKGVHVLLDGQGKESGRVEGRFVLTRQAHQKSADLTDDALKGVVLEPNADNTRLLYENPSLGLRLLYPRRWRIGAVRGTQVTIDERNGNGVLLTVDPANKAPTPQQFLADTRGYFEKQKAKVVKLDGPRSLQTGSSAIDHFAMEVELEKQKTKMEYFVLRQEKGSATFAARLRPEDHAALRDDIEKMARSVQLTGKK